ncbi:MAG TPA: DNA repair protein RadC [Gammaproteobacteria bacterium]|nr:DNA repair protein RadC [Gammaproteobacteria bacterium]
MAITDWPITERPREKLLTLGANALSDAELLAIFLRTGVGGKTAVDLARELLKEFNGLRHLLEATQSRFCETRGLGAAKYAQLQAILELNRRHLQERLQNTDTLSSTLLTKHYLISRLRHHKREVFACIFLNTCHHMLGFEELFWGTIDCANVYPREVVKRALHYNAAAVILAHNHPSGVAVPSAADKKVTSELSKALQLVDVRVLDHMVVGDEQVASFAELGLMRN